MTTMDLRDWRERAAAIVAEKGVDLDAVVVPVGETHEDVQERKERQARAKAARWLEALPVMYRQASLEALDEDQHGPALRAWLAGTHPTLVLAGTVGAGKTHAAYAVGNEAIHHGLYVVGVHAMDLLEAARPDGDRTLVRAAYACDLLVLDDFGVGRATEFSVETLTHLLGRRVSEGKRQVITTNSTAADIAAVWGPRLLSRLTEGAVAVPFRGPDRRRAAW
jgi:DNA replication protein DnaC